MQQAPALDRFKTEASTRSWRPRFARAQHMPFHRPPESALGLVWIKMDKDRDIEFIFEPQPEGGYHAYAPDLPGVHTGSDDLQEAIENAEEALMLYVEGLRDDGETLETR